MIKSKHLFITGMLRSGTTLLEKIINTFHPSSCIHYQPCMGLFVETKNAFLTSLGLPPEKYPLGHLFCESRFNRHTFNAFLENYRPASFPGLPEGLAENKYNKNFAGILPAIWSTLAPNTGHELLGAKEVLCEEYTPYLAENGYKIIFVIRDPRDVIASMNCGKGAQHVGAIRPTLYNLRIWRKSVAYALHLSELQKALYLKYEDLVNNPQLIIKRIMSWLGVNNPNMNPYEKLHDQNGEQWKGNSSFSNDSTISNKSVERYKELLPTSLIDYINSVCSIEMNTLKYISQDMNFNRLSQLIINYKEAYNIIHTKLPSNYSTDSVNINNELFRLQMICNNEKNNDRFISKYFLFKNVYEKYMQEN